MINVLKDMLLIEERNVFTLYKELMNISQYFIAPVFTIALVLEYFNEMNFAAVVKKLLLIVVFMSSFYTFHTSATKIALDSATKTLKRVSPSNLFIKKWFQVKIKTKEEKGWSKFKKILIPNVNDFVATGFFVLGKVFLWLLKLIYSSVYHLTYIFAGVTAILYFLGWTKDALKGTVQASLWCIVMPFVIVAILALVGNSIEKSAMDGDIIIAKIDTIIWLFGVTLLLLISPLISYGMIKGDGIHSFGSKMGAMVVSSGLKAMALYPMMSKMMSFAAVKSGLKHNVKSNYLNRSKPKSSFNLKKEGDRASSKKSNHSPNTLNKKKYEGQKLSTVKKEDGNIIKNSSTMNNTQPKLSTVKEVGANNLNKKSIIKEPNKQIVRTKTLSKDSRKMSKYQDRSKKTLMKNERLYQPIRKENKGIRRKK